MDKSESKDNRIEDLRTAGRVYLGRQAGLWMSWIGVLFWLALGIGHWAWPSLWQSFSFLDGIKKLGPGTGWCVVFSPSCNVLGCPVLSDPTGGRVVTLSAFYGSLICVLGSIAFPLTKLGLRLILWILSFESPRFNFRFLASYLVPDDYLEWPTLGVFCTTEYFLNCLILAFFDGFQWLDF